MMIQTMITIKCRPYIHFGIYHYQQVGNWTAAKLPLDVWALDMNWRHIGVNDSKASVGYCKSQSNDDPGCRDHFYRYVFQCSKYI